MAGREDRTASASPPVHITRTHAAVRLVLTGCEQRGFCYPSHRHLAATAVSTEADARSSSQDSEASTKERPFKRRKAREGAASGALHARPKCVRDHTVVRVLTLTLATTIPAPTPNSSSRTTEARCQHPRVAILSHSRHHSGRRFGRRSQGLLPSPIPQFSTPHAPCPHGWAQRCWRQPSAPIGTNHSVVRVLALLVAYSSRGPKPP